MHHDSLAEETDDIHDENDTIPHTIIEESPGIQEFDFDTEQESTGSSAVNTNTANRASEKKTLTANREVAGRFLRKLVGAGWLGEETLADFTRIINIKQRGVNLF